MTTKRPLLFLSSLLLLILCCGTLNAQKARCGNVAVLPQMTSKQMAQQVKDRILVKQWIEKAARANRSGALPALVTIPVVVHVLYNNPEEEISKEQIISQITALNKDFRRLNDDANETPAMFLPVAADCQIEFCLAQRDPNGYMTDGITWTYTKLTTFGEGDPSLIQNTSGGKDLWDPSKYLNLYVVNAEPGLLGDGKPNSVMVDYGAFGTIGNLKPDWQEGGVATHEIGHCLGLLHINGNNVSGTCGVSDGIDDTPFQKYLHETCPESDPNFNFDTCPGEGQDMYMNFMDYSPDTCINMFTEGQKVVMLNNFKTNGAKESLKFSNACTPSNICGGMPVNLNTKLITNISFELYWDNVYGAAHYVEVFYDNSWHNKILVPAMENSMIVNVPAGQKCKFRVTATCPSGNTSVSLPFDFITPPCGVATGLSVTSKTPSTVVLNWEQVPYANTYYVERKKQGEIIWKPVEPLATVSTTSIPITNLDSGLLYDFRVTSKCGMSPSIASEYFYVSPVCKPASAPVVTNITTTKAMFSWTAPAQYATAYTVEVFYGNAWHEKATDISTTYHLGEGLPSGSTCKVRIKTKCGTTYSAYSAEVPFKTIAGCSKDTYERNDIRESAYTLKPSVFIAQNGSKQTQIYASLCKSNEAVGGIYGDEDWFKFSNKSNTHGTEALAGYPTIYITLSSEDASHYKVKLFSEASGNAPIGVYSYNDTYIKYKPCAGVSDIYYVRVYATAGAAVNKPYTLLIELNPESMACRQSNTSASNMDITIAPNPSKGKFSLNFDQIVNNLKVVDMTGRIVMERVIEGKLEDYEIDITSLASGNYIIQLTGVFGAISKKIIKE